MDENLTFSYDEEGDVLEIHIGAPQKAISKNIGDDIIVHHHLKTRKIIGFTILNFEKRFENKKSEHMLDIPIEAEFKLQNLSKQ